MDPRVLAVVVCYNPIAQALAVQLKALAEQSVPVVIVDNASRNLSEIEHLIGTTDQSVTLLRQATNTGLGAAHNVGIDFARKNGYSHVLLLDQDSVPLPGMVTNLMQAWLLKSASGPVSAVGATYLNADNGSPSFFVRFGALKFLRQYCRQRDADECIQADFLISSGSLLALDAIQEIGAMDEALFIDHVDTEWFLRARSQGYLAWGVCTAQMQHGLGETSHQIKFVRGGRQRNVPQHQPFRYYYIFRNSVLLYQRDYTSWLWRWNDIQRLLMIAVMFGVFKQPRLANVRMMLKGIWHGIRGRSGPLAA